LYINIVLGGGGILGIVFNIVLPAKYIGGPFLGQYYTNLERPAVLLLSKNTTLQANIKSITVVPELFFKSLPLNILMGIIFLCIIAVILFYNYKLVQLFKAIRSGYENGTPFSLKVTTYLDQLWKGSVLLSVVTFAIALVKFLFIKSISVNNMGFVPKFDSDFISFLWLGALFFIAKLIFKSGLELKEEADLTI
jgi:hypothetical protein